MMYVYSVVCLPCKRVHKGFIANLSHKINEYPASLQELTNFFSNPPPKNRQMRNAKCGILKIFIFNFQFSKPSSPFVCFDKKYYLWRYIFIERRIKTVLSS